MWCGATPHKPEKTLFRDVIAELGAAVLGDVLWNAYHAWPMYSKFFDNKGALPHHIHQMEEHARRVGRNRSPKPTTSPAN